MWSLSNICAGPYSIVKQVFSSKIIDCVIECLKDIDFRTKKEATWVICNIVSASAFDLTNILVNKNIVSILCDSLRSEHDAKLLVLTLDSLKYIISSGEIVRSGGNGYNGVNPFLAAFDNYDGPSLLEKLQLHNDPKVCDTAELILTTFYETIS